MAHSHDWASIRFRDRNFPLPLSTTALTEQAASSGGLLGVGLHYLVDTSSTVKVRGPTRAAVEENAKLKAMLLKVNRF